MSNKILVAYASKYGATEGIAGEIAEVLRNASLDVDLLTVEQVTNLEQYSAVVLGSAVYIGNWRKEAAKFLEVNEAVLSQRPVWLFSSGPTGEGDASERMNGFIFPEALQPIADRIQPRDTVFLHGALDMNKLNFGERLLVRGIKASIGDFRDWDAIQAWAKSIVAALVTA